MPNIRLLEKEVTLTSQGHYEEDNTGHLILKRWRINASGRTGSWKPVGTDGNGGWPSVLTSDLKEPAAPASKKRRK